MGVFQDNKRKIPNAIATDLCYSVHNLVDPLNMAFEMRNASAQTFDVGFLPGASLGDLYDQSIVNSNSLSQQAYTSKIYDQFGNFDPMLPWQDTNGGAFNIADATGVALDHFDAPTQHKGAEMYYNVPGWSNGLFGQDFVAAFVLREELNPNNQRAVLQARDGGLGVYVDIQYRSAGQYRIFYEFNNFASPIVGGYQINIGANSTNFWLFTFAYIQGVGKLYIQNVERPDNWSGSWNITSGNGLSLSHRINSSLGKINDIKTLIIKGGQDLSAFDLSAWNQDLMTKHNI